MLVRLRLRLRAIRRRGSAEQLRMLADDRIVDDLAVDFFFEDDDVDEDVEDDGTPSMLSPLFVVAVVAINEFFRPL